MDIPKVGDIATGQRKFTEGDIQSYAELTGDFNPIHFDKNYTKDTIFEEPIVHGHLVLALVTTLFAKELPGPGTIYLGHKVKYINPVYLNDTITARLEVIGVTKKEHILIKTTCTNDNDKLILDGVARLKKM